uniref:Uncharacterized protein n=1 Tax=Schlesneria paludicola TaxID=360056 RepID=A0A7C2NXM5_9PLAN
MPRLLLLAFESPPHPDAVCHPATEDDVRFAIELLSLSAPHRRQLAHRLRRYLATQADVAPWSRLGVPCRRRTGLYFIVPWRLAKWLAAVLPAADGLIERTTRRLERWLTQPAASPVINATALSL